jgi:thymidylate kinase
MQLTVRSFFNQLNLNKIDYIHWKSNDRLSLKLQNDVDFDLLISEKSKKKFIELMKFNKFIPDNNKNAHIRHYYLLTKEGLIHMHIYYKLITGGQLVKSFTFNNKLLFSKTDYYKSTIRKPIIEIEYYFLIFRKIFEFSSLIELLISLRNEDLSNEIKYFKSKKINKVNISNIINKNNHINTDDFFLFQKLYLNKNYFSIFILSLKFRFKKKDFTSSNYFKDELIRLFIIVNILYKRLFLKKKSILSHSCIISFIGPDNSGKSTLSNLIYLYFNNFITTKTLHIGNPKTNLIQKCINVLYLLFNKKFYKLTNSNNVINKNIKFSFIEVILISLKSIMTALSRFLELSKAQNYKNNKKYLVICDRYIKNHPSFSDGPKIQMLNSNHKLLIKFFSFIEKSIYNFNSSADIGFFLKVDKKYLLDRNNKRDIVSKESDKYLISIINDSFFEKDFYKINKVYLINNSNNLYVTKNKIISFILDYLYQINKKYY